MYCRAPNSDLIGFDFLIYLFIYLETDPIPSCLCVARVFASKVSYTRLSVKIALIFILK